VIWAWLVLALLAAAGAPLFALVGAVALVGFHAAGYEPAVLVLEFQRLGSIPGLSAIPLFALAGFLLGASKAPQRLVRLSSAWLGWLPGGLAIVAVVTCALFTAFTGASGVTIVAMGALLYPALVAAGYPKRFTLGLLTAGGSLGLLFAPSLPLILFGFVAGQLGTTPPVTVEALFLAGIMPGLLMLLVLSMYCVAIGRRLQLHTVAIAAAAGALPGVARDATAPTGTGFSWREGFASLRAAAWELPLPVVVLGGIYSGAFAASEAAALTALYVLFVTVVARREIALRQLPAVMAEAARMVGAILLILGMALGLSNWLIDIEAPSRLFALIRSHVDSPLAFLLLLNLFLLAVGMLLDIFSAIVVLTPLLVPVAAGFGIHPVHLGIVMLANLQLGYFTPPVGMNLFIASYRFNEPILELFRASLPFFGLLLGCVLLISSWAWLSLGLL
jgi:C4-dicarboxylate transporter, DctM subunit